MHRACQWLSPRDRLRSNPLGACGHITITGIAIQTKGKGHAYNSYTVQLAADLPHSETCHMGLVAAVPLFSSLEGSRYIGKL